MSIGQFMLLLIFCLLVQLSKFKLNLAVQLLLAIFISLHKFYRKQSLTIHNFKLNNKLLIIKRILIKQKNIKSFFFFIFENKMMINKILDCSILIFLLKTVYRTSLINSKQEMDKYRILSVIGSGAYSQVFKAIQLSSGKMVAIKEMQLSKTNMAINKVMMRQVRVLNEIGEHPNIVKVIQCFKHKEAICIVLEYLPMDLITFYKAVRERQRRSLSDSQITYIFKQVCSGVAFMHSKNLIHRDIKPQNILIDPSNLKIKIIDFGFAKFLKSQQNTQYMVTRWYRPLQIVLNLPYDFKVDIFSLGAMLLQLYLQKQVFRSASNVDQLYWIINICGYPNWSQAIIRMRQMGINVPHNNANLPKLLKGLSIQAQDLITKMLIAIPHKRLSIFQVLQHSYFCQSARKTNTPSSSASETLQSTHIHPKLGVQKQNSPQKTQNSLNQPTNEYKVQNSERQSQRKQNSSQLNPEQFLFKDNQTTQRYRQRIVERDKLQHQLRGFHQSNEGRKKIVSGNKVGLGKRTQSFSQGLTITAARLKHKGYLKQKQFDKKNQVSQQLQNKQNETQKFQKYMPTKAGNNCQNSQNNYASKPIQSKQLISGISHSSSSKQISHTSTYNAFMKSQRNLSSSDKKLINYNSSSAIGLRTRGKSDYETNQKINKNKNNSYSSFHNNNQAVSNYLVPKKEIKMTMFAKVKKICNSNNSNSIGVTSKGIQNTQNKYAVNFHDNIHRKQHNSTSSSNLSDFATQRYSYGKNKQY